MIFFGTTSTTKVIGEGEFYCPQCETRRRYELKRLKRWVHLYWIPIIPLEEVSRWVNCLSCNGDFKEVVLEHDPDRQREEFERAFEAAMSTVMLKVALADGAVSTEKAELIADILSRFQSKPCSSVEVAGRIEQVRGDNRSIHEIVSSLAGKLTDSGKELMMKAAVLVAASGTGAISDAATPLLIECGQAIGMSSAHLRGVVSETLSG
jgi:hypothetical protein